MNNERIEIQPGEKILAKVHKHWILLVGDAISSILLASLPFIIFSMIEFFTPPADLSIYTPFLSLLAALWLLVIWLAFAAVWTNYYLDLWIVTNQRIISVDQISLFNRVVTTLDIERVQEIIVRTENIVQTVFHYGSITIETAGPTDDGSRMEGIARPERVRAIILKQIEHVGELEKSNEQQKELLHSISHEVKGYLTKDAAALSTIAEDSAVPASTKSLANTALTETRKGVDTVMNILGTSDFKNGAVTYESKVFDLTKSAIELVGEYRPLAVQKGLELTFKKGVTCKVTGDQDKFMRLVVRNLLDNAIAYTKSGTISVDVRRASGRIRLTVSDTGIGISSEDMKNLFTEGGRGEHSKDINGASTGYGLFVAKQVVEAHGGTIRACSDGEGKGSQFIVEIPIS